MRQDAIGGHYPEFVAIDAHRWVPLGELFGREVEKVSNFFTGHAAGVIDPIDAVFGCGRVILHLRVGRRDAKPRAKSNDGERNQSALHGGDNFTKAEKVG